MKARTTIAPNITQPGATKYENIICTAALILCYKWIGISADM
jgi:hypothetical protein